MKSIRRSTVISILISLFLLLQNLAFSQDSKTMELVLKVRDHDVSGTTPISGVLVSVYERPSNKLVQSIYTPDNGNAKFVLDLYKDYFFTFAKKDFVTKKMLIDASVKGKESKSKLYYYVEHVVNLYAITSQNLGAELIDKPFDKLTYDPSDNTFNSDRDYQASLKKDLAKLTPQDKSNLLNKLKAGGNDDSKKDDKYKEAIAGGDKAFGTKDYNKAKDLYTQALAQKPGDKYAQDKIKQVDVILKPRNPADAKYNDLLSQADNDFNAKQYEKAKKGYSEASKVKPGEKYPKDKIADIERIANKELSKKYKDAIFKADKLLLEKNYVKAKEAYTEAAGISPNENYPKDQIREIEKLMLPKSGSDDYKTLVANGDKAFKENNYDKAKEAYAAALKQKPAEKYPKDQLTKINGLTAGAANARKELERKYDAAMKKGKDALDIKDYETSKVAYTEASTLKPGEKLPKTQLAKVEDLIKNTSKEIDSRYNTAISLAEKELGLKHYENAKTSFNEALELKPNEKFPKTKLVEIDRLIKEMEKNVSAINNLITPGNAASGKDAVNSQVSMQLQEMRDEQIAKMNQIKLLKKMYAKHMANLSTKYNTQNPLTKLLDIIDSKEYHKQ